jgi:hypothetical protein
MTESHLVRKKKQPTYQVKINLLAEHFLVDAYKEKIHVRVFFVKTLH